MVVRTTQRLITAEEFASMPESRHAELIRGEIREVPLNNWTHAELLIRLGMLLATFVLPRRLGKVFGGDPGIVLERDPDTVRGPDIAFVATARLAEVRPTGWMESVASLVVEVLSPGNSASDIRTKVNQFLASGISLVWVVDPQDESVTEYRSRKAVRVLKGEDVLEGHDVLPGFRYRVRDIFNTDIVPTYPATA